MSSPQGQQRLQRQTQSPLFRLPAELRKEIWSHVLACGEVHLSKSVSLLSSETQKRFTLPRNSESYPQLLRTCHQAYDEGHEQFYSSNTFFISLANVKDGRGDLGDPLSRWTPDHMAIIKTLGIEFSLAEMPTKGAASTLSNQAPHIVFFQATDIWHSAANSLIRMRCSEDEGDGAGRDLIPFLGCEK